MLNALRLNEGFDVGTFASRTGLSMDDIAPIVASARDRGLLDVEGDRVRASELGQRFLNDTIALFLPDSPNRRSAA
jgi:oxygen-independent coproporphyrinogen-3 oxidase